jgi:hypothetical protein
MKTILRQAQDESKGTLMKNHLFSLLFTFSTCLALGTNPAIIAISITPASAAGEVTVTFQCSDNTVLEADGRQIDVFGNKVGLPTDRRYAIVDIHGQAPPTENALLKLLLATRDPAIPAPALVVVSDAADQAPLIDVGSHTGSATGTPGRIWWKNYIGTFRHPTMGSSMPGAARRTDYCLGQCVPQQ